jgi:hypothetical protein
VIRTGATGVRLREVPVATFAGDPLRAVSVAEVLYIPEIRLHVIDGRIVPREAVGPRSLKLEQERTVQRKADAYREPFDAGYRTRRCAFSPTCIRATSFIGCPRN